MPKSMTKDSKHIWSRGGRSAVASMIVAPEGMENNSLLGTGSEFKITRHTGDKKRPKSSQTLARGHSAKQWYKRVHQKQEVPQENARGQS